MTTETKPNSAGETRPAHTPGTWKYLPDESMIETAGPVNLSGDYGHICDFRSPVNEADARLIAAAPDLLAALQGIAKEISLSRFNVRKDFSVLVALAAGSKAVHKAINGAPRE